MFWTPKWKKEAKLTVKGATKFIHYKRDLLDEEHLKNIKARQQDVRDAIKNKDAKEVKKKCNLLEQECRKSLTSYSRPSWISENVEVIFVAIVIAIGLRTYALQPFRIPTGSMQPTLNGINGHVLPKDKWPSFAQRSVEAATHGRNYISIVSEKDDKITGLETFQRFIFFTRTRVHFENQPPMEFSCSDSSLKGLGLPVKVVPMKDENGQEMKNDQGKTVYEFLPIPVKAGVPIAEGFVDSGDLVLVDKVSYHFRKPERGETFVFDTRNVEEIHKFSGRDQDAGSHYIKRCVGVPGDTITLDNHGNIYIDGKIADDEGLKYAMQLGYARPPGHTGYTFATKDEDRVYLNPIFDEDDKIVLAGPERRQKAEYAAFGDNTENSSDSRYWGSVKQYNLVGPAFLSIWPFRHEDQQHWGVIK